MVHRLIIDAPASGAWNMAVDEALFQRASDCSETVLRLYQWAEPTLSLGYFQHASERAAHTASCELPLVRRSTGGGAIIHDQELTYSLIVQLADERPSGPRWWMARVHQSLAGLLADMNITVQICEQSSPGNSEPFLCFARHTSGDILIGENKVVGSAQRRRRRVLLQHGSILLDRSTCAPELPGINDISGTRLSSSQLIETWPKRFPGLLANSWTLSQLTAEEQALAQRIHGDRFSSSNWNLKRS